MIKRNNSGFTLVELILVMAITSIIIGAITVFMSASSRSYKAAESEISLQTEAQTIMNQISECVLEGNNVEYNESLRTLSIYHNDDDITTTTDPLEIIWFNQTNKNMYLYNTTIGDKDTIFDSISAGVVSLENLLGEYVDDFSVMPPYKFIYDPTGKKSTTLMVNIKMKHNDREFSLSEDIKLRNRIVNLP